MIARLILTCAIALAAPAVAETPGMLARTAMEALEAAQVRLVEADSARDRVAALTETVQAYESALEAVREGLRRVSIRERQIAARLNARDAEIAQLLGALQTVARDDAPTAFLHPAGPVGSVRAGMLLADLTPALAVEADKLRHDLEDLQALRILQVQVSEKLGTALTEVQQARIALNQAIANRTDLPQRFTEDPVRTALLVASSETLDAFSGGLDMIVTEDEGWRPPDLDDLIGDMPLPARGVILRAPEEADAAGIRRPGLLLATRSGALVSSPTAATIRYVGPLLDFGTVMILEPRPETLIVLAGLGLAYGETGQVIAMNEPLGIMGELDAGISASGFSSDGEDGGAGLTETLYIEVRQGNVPVNPLDWFRTERGG